MKPAARVVRYGRAAIGYQLLAMPRASLEIAVHPDKRVVVKAPNWASGRAVDERVRRRAAWIWRQIAHFEQYHPRTPPRQYVGGESHLYLGRKYRLKIERTKLEGARLKNGRLHIACAGGAQRVKAVLDGWYAGRARAVFAAALDHCWAGFAGGGGEKPALKMRDMKTRWGSMSPRRRLTLNLRLIQAPRECIDYVIVHELCHLAHPNHGAGFYRHLGRAMPDWPRRKSRLEITMA